VHCHGATNWIRKRCIFQIKIIRISRTRVKSS
jgi:hypothetical protein